MFSDLYNNKQSRHSGTRSAIMANFRNTYVVTHHKPDADAIFAVCIVLMFAKKFRHAQVLLRKSNWDGRGLKGRKVIVDIWARGKGRKGRFDPETGTMLSAFGQVVEEFCPKHIQEILAPLVRFLDLEDSTPSAAHSITEKLGLKEETRKEFEAHGLKMVFNVMKRHYGDDYDKLVDLMMILLRGYIEQRKRELRGEDLNKQFIPLAQFAPAWVVHRFGKHQKNRPPIKWNDNHRGRKIILDHFTGGIFEEGLAWETMINDLVKSKHIKKKLLKLREVMCASADGKTFAKHMFESADSEAVAMLNSASLETVFRSFLLHYSEDIKHRNDFRKVTQLMDILLWGYVQEARISRDAYILADRAMSKNPSDEVRSKIRTIGRDVVFIDNVDNYKLSGAFFDRGFKFVVRADGDNLIVQPNNRTFDLNIHHEELYEVIRLAGESLADIGFDSEDGQWFIHPDGHTLCRGSWTAPSDDLSVVDPWELCKAAKAVWDRVAPDFWASPEGQAMIAEREAAAAAKAAKSAKKKAEAEAKAAAEAQAKADEEAAALAEEARKAALKASKKAAKKANKRAKGKKRGKRKGKK